VISLFDDMLAGSSLKSRRCASLNVLMAWMVASLSGLNEHRKAVSTQSSSLDDILENMADDRNMNPYCCGAILYYDTST